MTASRALTELDATDILRAVAPATPKRGLQAQDLGARRALGEEAANCRTPRRAAPEHDDSGSGRKDSDAAASSATALTTPRRRISGKKIAASLSMLIAIGSLSGSVINGSAALSAAPAVSTAPPVVRDATVSRDAARPVLRTPATSAPTIEPQAPATAAETEAATPTPEATPEPAAPATPVVEEAVAAPEPAPAPPLSVAENIAPGQLPAASVEEALARAASMTGNWNYQDMCLALVATFYGYTSSGAVGAQQAAATAAAAGQLHTDLTDIPVGALIWYDGTPVGNPYGHVAMYAGDGMVYSNGAPTGVGLIPMTEPATGWGEPIIGWSPVWLPAATK